MSVTPVDQLSSKDLATLSCTYASIILKDDEQSISGDKIATLLKAAGVQIEKFWPELFAKSLQGQDISALLVPSAGAGGAAAAAPAAAAAGGAAAAAPKEEPKEEEEEGDFDMGSMFD